MVDFLPKGCGKPRIFIYITGKKEYGGDKPGTVGEIHPENRSTNGAHCGKGYLPNFQWLCEDCARLKGYIW